MGWAVSMARQDIFAGSDRVKLLKVRLLYNTLQIVVSLLHILVLTLAYALTEIMVETGYQRPLEAGTSLNA